MADQLRPKLHVRQTGFVHACHIAQAFCRHSRCVRSAIDRNGSVRIHASDIVLHAFGIENAACTILGYNCIAA